LEEVSAITARKARTRLDGSDAELVRQTLRGALHAFDELVRRYQRQATAVAYGLLSNRDDAMEVVQDAFFKSYDKLGTLSKPERFGPWLLRIVSNLSLNRRRSRALRKAESLDFGDPADGERSAARPDPHAIRPEQAAGAAELKTILRREIDALPAKQRQALVLFSIEKLPQAEVAELLDCSVEAVKWHVFTARKKLKDKLKDQL